MVRVIEGLSEDWRRLDERVDHLSSEIGAVARQDAGCERLMSVPGIGVVTALVAWYTSAAGVINGMKGSIVLPVGKPLMAMGRTV